MAWPPMPRIKTIHPSLIAVVLEEDARIVPSSTRLRHMRPACKVLQANPSVSLSQGPTRLSGPMTHPQQLSF